MLINLGITLNVYTVCLRVCVCVCVCMKVCLQQQTDLSFWPVPFEAICVCPRARLPSQTPHPT